MTAPTILDIALHWGAQEDENGGINGGEFERLGLPIMGGCQNCEASIAAYNAYPGLNGYLLGAECVDPESPAESGIYPTIAAFETDYPQEEVGE